MNYSDKIDAKLSIDGFGAYSGGHAHVETVHAAQAPSDAIIVPDAQLLFHSDFKRAGVDLVLSGDGREVVLHDYFKGEHRAPLASPDGAHLTGDLVTALAGEVQYAQADGSASVHQVIGHVTKLTGTATAIRNGVSIILNNGDNVEKGDVVASGSDSRLGVTFIDGTVFGLSSNARMVLNEMVYDPNGSNNSSLLSLVAGTITFVAGETAKHGDMKVDTPVATMGIRGTAVLVEIDFDVPGGTPDAKFQVLVEPDGTTGSYILFDKTTLTPLAVVNQAGLQINISNGIMSQTLTPLSPEIQQLINDVFTLKFTDSSTKSIQHFTDTIIPTDVFGPLKLADFPPNTPTISVAVTTFNTNAPGNVPPITPGIFPHIPNALHIATTSGIIVEGAGVTVAGQDTVSGAIKFVDINPTDRPTVSTEFSSFTLQNAQGRDITATLSAQHLANIQALEAALTLSANPENNNNGVDTWTYSIPASALGFLTPGSTLTLTYSATVNNNYGPDDETATAPITITIKVSGEIWSETREIASPAPGDWSTGANWETGVAPTSADDVIIVTDPQQSGTPFYPVTIKSAENGGVAAFADSVTMNDLGNNPPELDNYNTLTIGSGGLHLNADSILKNFGTISIGGLAEILQQSVLQNSGLLKLQQGGDFKDQSNISNSGTIEVVGGTLNVEVDVANSGGVINVDNGAILMLSGAIINGGIVNDGTATGPDSSVFDGIDITGPSTISNAFLNNGRVTIASGVTLTLDNDTVNGTAFNDTTNGAIIQIDDGTVLTLTDSAINGGIINDGTVTGTNSPAFGSIDITGPSRIDNVFLNDGEVTIASGVTLTLDNDTVSETTFNDTASGATIQIDDGTVLTLTGATINGGIIHDGSSSGTGEPAVFGSIAVTGPSTISNAFLSNGEVTIASAVALTLSNDTVTGTTFTDAAAGTIDIGGAVTFQSGVEVDGGAMLVAKGATLDIENPVTGIGATLNDVDVTNSGTIQVDSAGPGTTIISLELDGGTRVAGGTLLIHVGFPVNSIEGAVEIGTGGATFDNVAVENNNILTIDDGDTLALTDGTVISNGNLAIGTFGVLDVEHKPGALLEGTPDATLDGVAVGSSGNIEIGRAAVGQSTLLLDDEATVSGGALTVGLTGTLEIGAGGATLSDVAAFNGNVIEVLSDSALDLDLGSTIVNFGAITVDAAATLNLDGAIVVGGILNGDGEITTVGGVNAFDDLTIASATTVNVTDNTALDLTGLIINSGVIALNSSGDATELEISGNVLLDGNGHVALTDNAGNAIVSDGAAATLVNSNTISGAGTIGDALLTLVNDGSVDATGINPLIIDTGANAATSAGPEGSHWFVGSLEVTNNSAGVLEASSGHVLQIDDNVLNNGLIESGGPGGTSIALVNVAGDISGTGSIDIYDNAKVEIGGSVSSGQTVTFEVANGNAELILDDPHGFQGLVKGLVEASSEAAENYIDLKGFAYTVETKMISASFDSAADITAITITNGNSANNLTIDLAGNYKNGDIELANDGSGGTLFSDPAAAPSSTTVMAASKQSAGSFSAGDNFAFNFASAGHGHPPMAGFQPLSDFFAFGNPTLSSAAAALTATHDDYSNTVMTLDGHDSMSWNDAHKVHLHISDFHIA